MRERPNSDTAQSLIATVVELSDSRGELPVRTGHEPLEPARLDLDESDLDLVLDAAELYSE